ncbi:MAG: hypothetical protein ACJ8CB_26580 [Ktedonobacteraceae bacterium]
MAHTETEIRAAPHPGQGERVMRAINGQYMRSLWKSGLLILILIGLFVTYLLVKPGGQERLTFVDNIIQGLLEGVGLILALPLFVQGIGQIKQSRPSFAERIDLAKTSQRWVPVLLGLGILSYIIGQVLWTYNENILQLPASQLFPTWADAGFLGSYPFVLLALLLLPTRPLPADTRTRIVLDSLMIMVGVTTFSWYFILGPTVLQGADTVVGQVVGTAYPLMTLVLIFCLLLLVIHSNDSTTRPVALILALAFIIIVTTDSIYDYQELHNMYATGTMLDVGWPLGYMLVGLGARALRVVTVSRTLSARTTPGANLLKEEAARPSSASFLWKSLLPYLFVPIVVLLLGYTLITNGSGTLKLGVFLGAGILLGLLILRQIFAIREMYGQNQRLWEMHERMVKAELARERAERIRAERIIALNDALAASQQATPHARILALGHYQVRDSQGIYYNVYHRVVGEQQVFECECSQYQQQSICPHSLMAAALHSASDSPRF